jgi:alpha-tubulin suppressor-like RCC1 family protein
MLLSKLVRRTFATAGNLLTWGETTHGWGRPVNNHYWTPANVDNFSDVVSVSTGQYHLGFITQDNGVYTTGLDEDGRLGHASSSDTELPRRLSFDNPNTHITKLSCGTRHSLALAEDGTVYAWGYEGALGIGGPNKAGAPVRVPQEHFQGHKVLDIAAANDFSVALCDQGHFYAWGSGIATLPHIGFGLEEPPITKKVT